MRPGMVTILFFLCGLIISCDNGDSVVTVYKDQLTGLAQMGPYLSGSEVVLYELNQRLEQTGKIFKTRITDNKGTFQFNDISVSAPYVMVSVKGSYFNENTGEISSLPLQLNALINIRVVSSFNINILTHIEKSRIGYLIGQGNSFLEAEKIAQQEIFEMLDFPTVNILSSEKLDISRSGDGNAMLLAASLIIHGYSAVRELPDFLNAISTDLEQDGVLSDANLLNTLRINGLGLYFINIRSNLNEYYDAFDDQAIIPPFEDYVYSFLSTYLNVPTVSDGVVNETYVLHADIGGLKVTNDGGAGVLESGIVFGKNTNPTLNDSKISSSYSTGANGSAIIIAGLEAATKYYARFYATNIFGTGYGPQIEFTTKQNGLNPDATYGSVSDIDGNTYATISIGSQTWMAENLKASHYANGDEIPNKQDALAWSGTTSGAFSVYDNKPNINLAYGKLYNWYAVSDSRGLCPSGWHIPSDSEWIILRDYLGGEAVAGGKMKTGFWYPPNTNSNNESLFSGLPGGYRFNNGTYYLIDYYGAWWSATDVLTTNAWSSTLYYNNESMLMYDYNKNLGFSVRCIRD
jgi:uncharacterized protein (TIGR02145 family)